MARANNSRTLLDRITMWSPALLLGALAALTFWLDSQVQEPPPRRDGTQRHEPDLFVEGFRAVTLDANGKVTQSISGKRAEHFPDDLTTEIEEVIMAQTEAGKPAFRISATRARITGDRDEVFFTGNVRAVREEGIESPGEKPTGPIIVTTEYLHVIPGKDLARTDKAVTIEEPRGIIQSVGLELDNKAKTLKLRSAVRGTFQPQALPK
jgi:lipopolysaccharide export system protein LptC